MKMNSNSLQICRLCLESTAGSVNIFEKFQDSTIATVLTKHFWFQINQDDGMPERVCETCWSQTKTFHLFYKRLEIRHQNHENSIVLLNADDIKQERSISPMDETLESELCCVDKCNQEIDIKVEDTQLLSKEEDCDEDDNDSNYEQSEAEQTTDEDEDESCIEKTEKRNSQSQSEIEEQDAEIRRFFTMKCDICRDFDFVTLLQVRKHYRQVHQIARGYLKCCGKKYKSRNLMLDHVQYHVNPEAHRCDQCGKSFRNRYMLDIHIKNHVRAYKCSLCSSTFPTAVTLKYHVKDKHSTDKIRCDQCGKFCRSNQSLTNHKRNVHKPTVDHVCEVCGRTFKTKLNLETHSKLEHATTPPPKVQCDICGFWLKHEGLVRKHLKWHQEIQDAQADNAKFLSCPICDKKVKTKRMLSSHMQYNHAERKYKCTFCDKAFKTNTSLKEHVAAIHTGADLYNCPYCDKTFKSNANMYSHRKKAHLAEWTKDKAEKIKGHQVTLSESETTAKVVDE